MQEVAFGWLFRHMHGVAASVVFLIIYIHMFTGSIMVLINKVER